MSWARRRALLLLVLALLAAAVLALALERRRAKPPSERPTLLLLTSLPLVFGEDFSLEGGGSPALTALRTRYRVIPISVTDPAELAKGRLLLMAQPFAQPAEDLVALDDWVRRGGRLMLLADPMLEWPGQRPLGDPLRPPAMFMDTGLLGHWGLRLDSPDQRGPKLTAFGGHDVLTVSPGQLYGGCRISGGRVVAHCRIGKGRVTIVADADLLDVADPRDGAEHNLDAVLSELSSLER
jgi:hypothetical protein